MIKAKYVGEKLHLKGREATIETSSSFIDFVIAQFDFPETEEITTREKNPECFVWEVYNLKDFQVIGE